jgi:hypothetical protein
MCTARACMLLEWFQRRGYDGQREVDVECIPLVVLVVIRIARDRQHPL